MPLHHLELYHSSITVATLAQLNSSGVGNVVPTLNNGYQVPNLNYLAAVYGVGTSLARIQAQARSMLPYPYPDLVPTNRGSAFESPVRGGFMFQYPKPMKVTEELDVFVVQNSGGSETEYVGVNFSDGPITPVPFVGGFTVHCTATKTLTAGAWTTCQITPDTNLPASMYQLVGLRAFSATALFARIFPTSSNQQARPGTTAMQTYDQMDTPFSRHGASGIWYTFPQNVLPQIDFFATSADTAEEVWLDLIPSGPNLQQGAILSGPL
jgi:hypothetical protein